MFRILNTLKKTLATESEKEQFVNFKRKPTAWVGFGKHSKLKLFSQRVMKLKILPDQI